MTETEIQDFKYFSLKGPQAFATFPTLPCLQVLWKEISNNSVSEEEKQERKRETNIKKTIKRSRRVGFNHHQSKTPTLASEQRNARHLNHHVGCPQKWPDCRPAVASWLESLWPPGAKKVTTISSRPPHLPKREKWKKQTSNSRSSSGRKYRKQSEASVRPRRGL